VSLYRYFGKVKKTNLKLVKKVLKKINACLHTRMFYGSSFITICYPID